MVFVRGVKGLRSEDNVNLIIEILSKFELVVSHPSLGLGVTFYKFVISVNSQVDFYTTPSHTLTWQIKTLSLRAASK